MLEVDRVSKRYDAALAVDAASFTAGEGRILGLLGPNGAGKTSILRMVNNITKPDAGAVRLDGHLIGRATQAMIGCMPEERGLYKKVKVIDQLIYLARLRGLGRNDARRSAAGILDALDAGEWHDRRPQELSRGMQQKVQFISAVIHNPAFLILDEPFSGLDPINQDFLEQIVREFRDRGTAILFSTHLMHHAEQLCDRVCLISDSEKIIDSDLRALKASERGGVVAVEFEGSDRWIRGPEVARVEERDGWIELILRDGADHQPILERAVASGVRILRFELVEPSLHEIFLRYAGGEAAGNGRGPGGGQEASRTGWSA